MKNKMTGEEWWSKYRVPASLLLPADDLDRVYDCETTLKDIREELRSVYQSSKLGESLVAKAYEQSKNLDCEAVLDECMAVLTASREITEEILATNKAEFLIKIQELSKDHLHRSFLTRKCR